MKETSPTSAASTPSPPSEPERSTSVRKHPGPPLVYIAGKFSAEKPYQVYENVQAMVTQGGRVAFMGGMPVVPHKNSEHYQGIQDDDFWYAGTLALAAACDAIFVPHSTDLYESKGTKREWDQAQQNGQPSFLDPIELMAWITRWNNAS